MSTLVTKAVETSKLAASQTVLIDPTQADRMATIKACPDLLAWLEADTLYQISGANAGWRDRISGKLFGNVNSGTFPTLNAADSDFNNAASLVWPASGGAVFTDGGAGLFPNGISDLSIVLVGKGVAAQNNVFVSDNQAGPSATWVNAASAGQMKCQVNGTTMVNPAISNTTPFQAMTSLKYGEGGTGQFALRYNRATKGTVSSISAAPIGSTLALGGYASGNPINNAKLAAVMVFKGALLHGSYGSNQYANLANKTLSQIIEDYLNVKYGV